jgi:opacity protein-like surface antigen
MKKLLSSLTFLAVSCFVHAQKTTHPGYIVRSTGDTVRGYLQEVLITDEVSRVGFKPNAADNEFTLYTPDQVTAFQYDSGHVYRALTFTNTLRSPAVPQTSFARLLVSGECELYSLHDNTLYFLVRKNATVHFLYDDDIHAEPFIPGNFRNKLNFFAVGCDSAREGIERLAYNEESLIRYFRNLDACLNPNQTTTVYYQKAKAHWGFFAYAGGFVYSGHRNQFTGEARLQLTFPQLTRGLSFNLGFRYVNTDRRIMDPITANYLHPSYGIVNYKQTSIPLTLQYNLTHGIVQPYIFVGASALQTKMASTEIYLPFIEDEVYKTWNVALLAGVGVEVPLTGFLQARVEWRYEQFIQFPTLGVSVRF